MESQPDSHPTPDRSTSDLTVELIHRVRTGDGSARELLAKRFLPELHQWARGRLPAWARDVSDTGDLVSETFVRAMDRLDGFEPRHEGAFLAYLRQSLRNAIRDHIRAAKRRPPIADLPSDHADDSKSPLEEVIGRDLLDAYERALDTLPELDREAVILRLEFRYSHEQVAGAIGSPTAQAARMRVSRALVRLAEEMERHEAAE